MLLEHSLNNNRVEMFIPFTPCVVHWKGSSVSIFNLLGPVVGSQMKASITRLDNRISNINCVRSEERLYVLTLLHSIPFSSNQTSCLSRYVGWTEWRVRDGPKWVRSTKWHFVLKTILKVWFNILIKMRDRYPLLSDGGFPESESCNK